MKLRWLWTALRGRTTASGCWCGVLVLALVCLPGIAAPLFAGTPGDAAAMDWPHWRGPEMNGISREKNLPDEWSPDGDNLVWKREDLGSRSTPVVMDGLLYTIVRDQPGTPQEGEKVVCVDAATGKTKWESVFNVFLSDVPDTRVGWSSVAADPVTKRVFALGVCGYFQCLDAKTGKIIWDHSLSEEYGLLSTYGGRTNFPIVYDEMVIISAVVIGWGENAKPAHRFLAFDQRNGQPVWFVTSKLFPKDTTYSAPVLTSFNGTPAIVFGAGDGAVYALQPATGKRLWKYSVSARGINTTPVVAGSKVICGHSEENLNSSKMGALFCLDGTKSGDITDTGAIWNNQEWFVGKSAPLVVGDRVYACEDTGTLQIAELETGKKLGSERLGGPMRSSPIYADGKIYLLTENGRWWVFKPTEDGVETVTRARLRVGESYGSPIVSHGKMYIPTTLGLYCISNADAKPAADERPAVVKAADVNDDKTPAQVQVVPVQSVLQPGQSQALQFRLFNAKGQYLGLASELNTPVELSVDGAGSAKDGKFQAPDDAGVAAATITASIGDIKGTAAVRIFPELPWEFTFDDGKIPAPWIGMSYRHVPIDYELLTTLRGKSNLAADLYIAVTTSFENSGRPAVKFDDSTVRTTWTDLVDYLGISEQITSLADARKLIDPALKMLTDEGVLAGHKWSKWADRNNAIELMVQRGKRRTEKGNGVMMKIRTIPLGRRSQGWIGPISFKDYTIQADVLGAIKDGKLPDMGLIGQRYTIDLMGAAQKLQIRTWPPQLRMAKSVPFSWKPNVWYTMKMQSTVEDGQAVLRGKVWERGAPEPKDWTVEARDPVPNSIGSPGFFGNAKDAEIFYDNVKVFANSDS